jgi:hypothetical protein
MAFSREPQYVDLRTVLISLGLLREQGRAGAVFRAELSQDAFDVLLDCARTHAQSSPDLAVGGAPGQPGVHLALTRGQQRKTISLPV